MIYLATIAYLLFALCRRDWILYEFDDPIILWELCEDGWYTQFDYLDDIETPVIDLSKID